MTYNTQKYYVFNSDLSGSGLTELDNITLPYPTVIGFEYLLDTLPPSVNAVLDYIVEMELSGKEQNITLTINKLDNLINTIPMRPSQRRDLHNELSAVNSSMHVLFQDLEALVATSDSGDLLLKTLLCKVPSGISPFFVQQPGKACKHSLSCGSCSSASSDCNSYAG